MELQTVRKWVVSGTPIQNNLMEFWSLINWLDFGIYAGKKQMKHFKRDIVRLCKASHPRGFERLQVSLDETVKAIKSLCAGAGGRGLPA